MFKRLVGFAIFLSMTPALALDMSPSGVYRATKEACVALPEEVLFSGNVYDKVYAGIFPTRDYFEMDANIRSHSLKSFLVDFNFRKQSDFATYLLSSEGTPR